MRTHRLAFRTALAVFVFGVALAVGLAAGGGTVAAQAATALTVVMVLALLGAAFLARWRDGAA